MIKYTVQQEFYNINLIIEINIAKNTKLLHKYLVRTLNKGYYFFSLMNCTKVPDNLCQPLPKTYSRREYIP